MTPEQRKKYVEVKSPFFRPGTLHPKQEVIFVYNFGGIGDYIHWTTAIQWAIESHPWLYGEVVAPGFFFDLAQLWLKNYYPRFTVRSCDYLEKDERVNDGKIPLRIPSGSESANACGFHLLQLGFTYYGNIDRIPKDRAQLPRISGYEADIAKFGLDPSGYVVVTTEATTPVRTLKSSVINEIVQSVKDRGLQPVFLGKKDLREDYKATSDDGIITDGVLDLREKTTLVEAAVVLSKAKAVIGLDNGLLHLACCSDVPVIFAFTTVDPRHRIPPRPPGAKTISIVPPEKLSCRFCQSNMRFLIGHEFSNCIYGDLKCVETMESKTFIAALDNILEKK